MRNELKELERRLRGTDYRAQTTITESDVRRIVLEILNNNNNPQRVQSGYLRSGNFISGQIGWSLEADGSAEFQKVNIGNEQIMVKAGDSIQDAVDDVYAAGGGVVFLRNGTHTLAADLTLYSNVYLVGESMYGTVVDCNGGNYSIVVNGSNGYNTGTCDMTYGSDQISGNSTTWTTGMAGRSMLLDGVWYVVASVEAADSLTLATPYIGDTVTTAKYMIATPIESVKIASLTVQDSTGPGIDIQKATLCKVEEVYLYNNSGYGIYIDSSAIVYLDIVSVIACTNSVYINVAGTIGLRGISVIGGTGYGISANEIRSSTFIDIGSMSNTGDGINFNAAKNIGLMSFSVSENGDDGISFLTGTSTDIQISNGVCKNNTGDGIDVGAYSDNNLIYGCSIHDNGGYGINIASGSDNNVIHGNFIDDNASGQISDAGLGNEMRDNVGIPDTLNNLPTDDHTTTGSQTNLFNAGESVTIMDCVYLKTDGEWWKTDADAASTASGLLGISLETKTDGNKMKVALPNSFVRDDSWDWTVGATLYLDTATAGGLTETQPSGEDDAIRVVGYAVTADIIYFAPSGNVTTYDAP